MGSRSVEGQEKIYLYHKIVAHLKLIFFAERPEIVKFLLTGSVSSLYYYEKE